MLDRVTISHRGASYEIGRGRDFYGIWAVGAPRSEPFERWPETPEGWYGAWARFTAIELPGTISAVDQVTVRVAAPSRDTTLAAGLLGAGVVLSVASLFPDYIAGASLAQQPAELVPHVIYLALGAVAALLMLAGAGRARTGALLAAGASATMLGFFIADAGTASSAGGNGAGAGLVLGFAGWALGAAGAAVAMTRLRTVGAPTKPRGAVAAVAVVAVLVALGTAMTFAPSWDSYTLHAATGQTEHLTAGNAFSNPGLVIFGNVTVMVALVVVAGIAAIWRPAVAGASLLVGAAVPMVAQVVSALIQFGEATPSTEFGVTKSQASALQLHISNGLTPIFFVYCGFLAALLLLSTGLTLAHRERAPGHPAQVQAALG